MIATKEFPTCPGRSGPRPIADGRLSGEKQHRPRSDGSARRQPLFRIHWAAFACYYQRRFG